MTRLTFSGMRNRKRVTVTWEDGRLSGHAPTVAWIRRYAGMLEGQITGPIGGPYTTTDHLHNPYVAAEIIRSVFPGKVTMAGELPLREAPAGTIQ